MADENDEHENDDNGDGFDPEVTMRTLIREELDKWAADRLPPKSGPKPKTAPKSTKPEPKPEPKPGTILDQLATWWKGE